MIKLKPLLFESKILVSRRSGKEREKRWIQEIYRKIQDYIKNGSSGTLDLIGTPIKILPDNLKRVDGNLWLENSQIEDLNNLEYVRRNLDLRYTPIKKLPDNLKRIECNLILYKSKIEDLNNLEYVGGILYLRNTPLSKTTTVAEIRSKIYVREGIYL
jgi:hypothetical protein